MNFKDEVLSYLGHNQEIYDGFNLKEDNYEGEACGKKGRKGFLAGELTPEEEQLINLFRKNEKRGKKGGLAGEMTPEEKQMLALFQGHASVSGEPSPDSPKIPNDHTNGRCGSADTEDDEDEDDNKKKGKKKSKKGKKCPECGKDEDECECSDETEDGSEDAEVSEELNEGLFGFGGTKAKVKKLMEKAKKLQAQRDATSNFSEKLNITRQLNEITAEIAKLNQTETDKFDNKMRKDFAKIGKKNGSDNFFRY